MACRDALWAQKRNSFPNFKTRGSGQVHGAAAVAVIRDWCCHPPPRQLLRIFNPLAAPKGYADDAKGSIKFQQGTFVRALVNCLYTFIFAVLQVRMKPV